MGKGSNHFNNVKTSLKNDPFHKSFMNNIRYFVTKYLKQTFQKSYMKSGPSNLVLIWSILWTQSNRTNILALKSLFYTWIIEKDLEIKSHVTGSITCSPGINYLWITVWYVQCFSSKCLRQSIEKQPNEIGSIKYVAGMKNFTSLKKVIWNQVRQIYSLDVWFL